ncbi:uncharacterized protein PAC_02457 [Phialocephala subalpina]|uniref:2EXR domain-containing protein n=1 Tax=Phialocephala subalpina TaxID=576137 RepID=A0A1L7WIH9_9HELO|nr:uncharacterized protein PAC_02457 [Phialocephala subalpina]
MAGREARKVAGMRIGASRTKACGTKKSGKNNQNTSDSTAITSQRPTVGDLQLANPSQGLGQSGIGSGGAGTPNYDSADQSKGPLTEFTLFPELPIELRVIVWRHAANNQPGGVLVQHLSAKPLKGYTLTRKIPGLLQACQESRNELLIREKNQAVEHRTYGLVTLTQRDGGTPVPFSPEIDTFWAAIYKKGLPKSHTLHYNVFSALADLLFAASLRFLAVKNMPPVEMFASQIIGASAICCPNLEVLTVLVSPEYNLHSPNVSNFVGSGTIVAGPEVNESLDVNSLSGLHLSYFTYLEHMYSQAMKSHKVFHLAWEEPRIKFRLLNQFMAAERMTLSQDALKSMAQNPWGW